MGACRTFSIATIRFARTNVESTDRLRPLHGLVLIGTGCVRMKRYNGIGEILERKLLFLVVESFGRTPWERASIFGILRTVAHTALRHCTQSVADPL